MDIISDTLVVSHVSFRPIQLPVTELPIINVRLIKDINELPAVDVHNGYQAIPVEQATGSFKKINMQFNDVPRFNVQESFENILCG